MRYLILHGWQGSGPDHWQTWLAGRLEEAGHDVVYPLLPDPDHPDLDLWLLALDVLRAPEQIVVCHSLACCLWLHHRARGGPSAERVLLVAPPHPDPMVDEIAGFFPVPLDPALAHGTRVVWADDDPYCPRGGGPVFAEPLGAPADLIPGGGHLNTDAGFGAWPEIERWCVSPSGPRRLGPAVDVT